MGKRKLRNCTRCGTRHGPPTGKSCARPEFEETEKNEVQAPEPDAAPTDAQETVKGSLEEGLQSIKSDVEDDQDLQKSQKSKKKHIFKAGDFVNYPQRHERNRHDYADSEEERTPSDSQQRWRRPQAEPETANTFERSMSERMLTMENLLGRVVKPLSHKGALTHSRLTPSFWKCSQGLEGKTPIIDRKANIPWIILVQKSFQNVDRK